MIRKLSLTVVAFAIWTEAQLETFDESESEFDQSGTENDENELPPPPVFNEPSFKIDNPRWTQDDGDLSLDKTELSGIKQKVLDPKMSYAERRTILKKWRSEKGSKLRNGYRSSAELAEAKVYFREMANKNL